MLEVLSPSTHRFDRSQKVERYREIETVRLLVLVDPVTRTLETDERIDAASWRVTRHAEGAALELTYPPITLSAEEIFAED